jgi:hypothetical protein
MLQTRMLLQLVASNEALKVPGEHSACVDMFVEGQALPIGHWIANTDSLGQ